jgi:cytochrome c553
MCWYRYRPLTRVFSRSSCSLHSNETVNQTQHPYKNLLAIAGAVSATFLLFVDASQGAPLSKPTGSEIFAHGIVGQGTPACQSCHGGLGSPPINAKTPAITGLDAGYLERQLDLFGKGLRRNLAMMQVARSLNQDNRTTVARYLADQPRGAVPGPAAKGALEMALGRQLAERGRWAVNVPPCASCHGADGLGVGATSPALAGQSAAYIEGQLIDWSDGDRSGDPLGLMTGIAKRLNAKERSSVAAYYGSLRSQPARSRVSAKAPG